MNTPDPISQCTHLVTRKFTAGVLNGLTVSEPEIVAFEVGREYSECIGSGRYVVTECRPIPTLTRRQHQMLGMAANNRFNGGRGVPVADPDEKRTVRKLEAWGLVRVIDTGRKFGSEIEWRVYLAS